MYDILRDSLSPSAISTTIHIIKREYKKKESNRTVKKRHAFKIAGCEMHELHDFFLSSNCSFTRTMHINEHFCKCAFVSSHLIFISCPLASNKSKNRTLERKQQKQQKMTKSRYTLHNHAE